MIRILTCVLVAGLTGCSAKPFDRERARQALTASTEQVRQAMLREDHQRMADLTHPAVINGLGGREKFTQQLAEIAAEAKVKGFGFADVIFSESSELVESRGAVYAVVPFDLRMTGPDGAKGVTPSYLIGVSTDGGASWKFIDGNGIAGDRAKLRQVLPGFPDTLALPPKQNPKWKD
jgi:hypothetical protein